MIPQEIRSWKTSDEQVHTCLKKAVKHELTMWFFKATDANKPASETIVGNLTPEAIDLLVPLMTALKDELNSSLTTGPICDSD